MGYASLADLTIYGLPATALGNLTVQQQQDALDTASDEVDSYLRGRYALPLQDWGVEIRKATCVLAAYELMAVRGYEPGAGADPVLQNRYNETIAWLNKVQRQAAHPNVTPAQNQVPDYNQPTVISSSVIDVFSGRRAANRGW